MGRAPPAGRYRDSCGAKKRGLCCRNTTGPFPQSGQERDTTEKDAAQTGISSPSTAIDAGHNRDSLNPSADPCGNAKCATSVLQHFPDLQFIIDRWPKLTPEKRAAVVRLIQE